LKKPSASTKKRLLSQIGIVGKHCENTESAPEGFSLHRILNKKKKTNVLLGSLKFPNGSYTESMKKMEPSYRRSLSGISGVSTGLGGTTKDQGEI
jgi:hypothetical protein